MEKIKDFFLDNWQGLLLILLIFLVGFDLYLDIPKKIENNYLEEDNSLVENTIDPVDTIETKKENVLVDVKGCVKKPGVYEIALDKVVNDAIKMAGGLKSSCETKNINLSKKLKDEMVIYVPTKVEVQTKEEEKINSVPKEENISNDALVDSSNSVGYEEKEEVTVPKESKINLNTATKEELMTLSGIGESKAEAIIKYREDNGSFKTIEEIKNVSGIGDAAFEKIKDNITV